MMNQSLHIVLCIEVLILICAKIEGNKGWYKHNSLTTYHIRDKINKACEEKDLEVRKKNAAVIFTGTIREMEADLKMPEMQKAKVEIKRVLKGDDVLIRLPRLPVDGMISDHRRIVLVEGISDPAICHSEARIHDTRIFFVSKASNGELRLNSSLVRMTLDNIQKAEDAYAVKDLRDPCKRMLCSFGATCVASHDGLTAQCQCPERCDSFGDAMGNGQICGSDGRNYANICEIKKKSCEELKVIEKKYDGKCDPCSGFECPLSQVCQLDSSRRPLCKCGAVCPLVFNPVCGSNGKTYSNDCIMRVQACKDRMDIRLLFHGECTSGKHPCHGVTCGPNGLCVVDYSNTAHCTCPPSCEPILKPVCGSNGQTYPSECHLQQQSCNDKRVIIVSHIGECSNLSNVCTNYPCHHEAARCVIRNHQPICICPVCTEEYDPVCGSNGMSYVNLCKLNSGNCELQTNVTVVHKGKCDPCADVKCKFGGRCEDGKCICHNDCPASDEPVCGNDGSTYLNECTMQKLACSQNIEIEADHAGSCEDASGSGATAAGIIGGCDPQTCRFGGICKPGKHGNYACTCEFNCDAIRSPVCGTDDKTYGNECQMNMESCQKQMAIHIQPMDNCQDIFEVLCDGKPALINQATGKEFDCYHGNNCPAGSYCDKPGVIGKCCSGDQSGKICMESRYGCCPDDVTPAAGPNNIGCPNVCNCHPLGANGTTCDPLTHQCICKPGVGGLKCDRCNPTYWGLPKISEGNGGCIPCDCNMNGSRRNDCEQMTGRCDCRPGITGQKCNVCPNGKKLELKGCSDLMLNDHLTPAMTCSDKQCHFGAVCQVTNGIPECNCQKPEDDQQMMVCGSDGQSYASTHQLRWFACRLQKHIRVVSPGSCQKSTPSVTEMTTSTKAPLTMMNTRKLMNSHIRMTKDLKYPSNVISPHGMLGDFCQENRDCFVTGSFCKNGLCVCQNFLIPGNDKKVCIAERFIIPSFAGHSYLRLKRLNLGSRDIAIEIEFQPKSENGILFYVGGQDASGGEGDFLSLTLKNGHVEFRYNLGSGTALLRTVEKVRMDIFQKVTAMRFGKKGVLKLDDGHKVSNTSPGMLRFLNFITSIFLGFVPDMTDVIVKNVGVNVGFVGCIKSLHINSSELNIAYDLTRDRSVDIEHQHNIHECRVSACGSSPCLNGGTCVELGAGINFNCNCSTGYTGLHCEDKMSCSSNPCQNEGDCLQLDNGHFVCNCAHSYDGERCEKVIKQQPTFDPTSVTTPEFLGDSFIRLRLSKTASRSLSFEIWFLPIQPTGVLLYSAQENVVRGDFLALNLVNGYVQLRYNLGSGTANITSQTTVKLGMWNKVIMSLRNRLGSLSLNDDRPAKGQSAGEKKELNLPMKIYVGGYPHNFNSDAEVQSGFVGAIQKIFKDKKLVENLLSESLLTVHITQYDGPPCPADINPCHNGGTCIPNLNDFECQCMDPFIGITCQMRPDNFTSVHSPIAFNGHTHYRYDRYGSTISERSQASNKFQMTFKTESTNGLMLLMHKKNTVAGDYLALAISGGHVLASLKLGKEMPSKSLLLSSRISVDDGRWHNLTFTRIQRSAHLFVDHDQPVSAIISSTGATHLDTNGHLWIGGSKEVPFGLPRAFYIGFKGCIKSVTVDNQSLNLVKDRVTESPVSFCSINS